MDISFFTHDLNIVFTGGIFGTTALTYNTTNQKMKIIQVDIHKCSAGKFRIKNRWFSLARRVSSTASAVVVVKGFSHITFLPCSIVSDKSCSDSTYSHNMFLLSIVKYLFCVLTRSNVIFLSECFGKILNGIETEHERNLTDRVFVLTDQLTTLIQF